MGLQPLRLASFFEVPSSQEVSPLWAAVVVGEQIVALTILLVLMPALFLAALITTVLSRRSPLVAHSRVGRSGRPIRVLKLRTMWDGVPCWSPGLVEHLPIDIKNVVLKTTEDPRVKSRFAAFCRRYSIDELPQLWHVFRGEMALIGPRPLTSHEIEAHYGADAAELLSKRPGLSGLWQVSGRNRLNYRQRRRLDLFMLRKWSLRLYLTILIRTVPKALLGTDAW